MADIVFNANIDFNCDLSWDGDLTATGTQAWGAGTLTSTKTGVSTVTGFANINLIEASDGAIIDITGASFVLGDTTLNTSGNIESHDHGGVANDLELFFTNQSSANMGTQPVTTDNITLRAGNWTLGITADNDDYGTLTIDATTLIQLVTFCDIYVDAFTNNGTWNRITPYTGLIHVGSPPFDDSGILDVNIKLDNPLDSINILEGTFKV